MYRKNLTSLGVAVGLLVGTIVGVAPAQASTNATTEPGSVTAVFNNTPGKTGWTSHANATGWASGTINLEWKLYIGSSQGGPWTQIGDKTATGTRGSAETPVETGACGDGWYKVVASASGPGGAAENNPDVKIVHVYGTISTKIVSGAPMSAQYASSCKNVIQPI